MKFEAHLRENLVPEWRDQYVNYKEGKKQLKRLFKKSPSVLHPRTNQTSPRGTAIPVAVPARGSSSSVNFGDGSEPQKPSKRYTSGQLLNQNAAVSPSRNLDTPSSLSQMGIHRTDTLELPPPALHQDSQRRESSISRQKSQQSFPQKEQAITDESPLLGASYEGYASVGPQPSDDGYKLEPMNDRTSHKIFLAWIDGQVDKVENFYISKEKEALARFLTLQDQLIVMDSERKASKAKLRKADAIRKATVSTRFAVTKKMDLPSLPDNLRRRLGHGHEDSKSAEEDSQHTDSQTQTGVAGDYTRRTEDVPYTVAVRRLKIAVTEFYIALELLKGYRALNLTAVRKIAKKFDKTAHTNYMGDYMNQIKLKQFVQSDLLDNLLSRTEDMFALYFEDGNHKRAVAKLRAKEIPEYHYMSMFSSGLFIGVAIPLLIQAIVNGVQHLGKPDYPDTKFLFQIWAGFFLVALVLCLFSINFGTWTKFKINYPFIFEFDMRHHLDYQQYSVVPALLMFILALFAWLSLSDYYKGTFEGRYYPPIFLGIAVIMFLIPLPIFHWRSRKWLIIAISRLVLSGLYPVEFRDFFLGDIFCSLNYSLSNLSFFFCLYADSWNKGSGGFEGYGSRCSSSNSRVLGFLNCLPGIWRFLQCLRRYGDTGDWFPHLANSAKYTCWVMANMFLSLARIDRDYTPYRIIYIIFASLNSTYSLFWDVFMDFSLGQPDSKNPGLRNELAFGARWPYYSAMIIDAILRFNWIFYAIFWEQIEQSATVSFFVAFSELLRRFLWVFFRVENEHCANVTYARASRDISLPYSQTATASRHASISGDEESGVGTDQPSTQQTSTVGGQTPATTASKDSKRTTFAGIATPVILAVSSRLRSAHTSDFQRRKPQAGKDGDGDDDDDNDEDDDEEEGTGFDAASDMDDESISDSKRSIPI